MRSVAASYLAAIAVGIYCEYQGFMMTLSGGRIVEGILVMGFVAMVAKAVVSVVSLPGTILVELGGSCGEMTSPGCQTT